MRQQLKNQNVATQVGEQVESKKDLYWSFSFEINFGSLSIVSSSSSISTVQSERIERVNFTNPT